MNCKKPLFALASLILFFVVLEALLALAGVATLLSERDPFAGFSEQVRVFELDPGRGVYRTPRRAVQHSFNYQEFAAHKPDDGFRVFVLGGSSAYGFPWGGSASFAQFLGKALEASWPERTVETVNAAAMSYGSHRLRILTRELLDYAPDVFVIYGGHNEFVERRFYRDLIDRNRDIDRLTRTLHAWRLYSALSRAHAKLMGPSDDASAAGPPDDRSTGELLGLDVAREYSVDVGQAELSEVRERFEENLTAILEMARGAGSRVVLCTVPSNLTGWVPNQSRFDDEVAAAERREVTGLLARARASIDAGSADAAITPLERARSIAPGYAETHFLLGRAYGASQRWEEARHAYILARDHDAQPSRAMTGLNETIRRLAADEAASLVDIERVFELESVHGLYGFDLFEDYVHPNRQAHVRIAYELWRTFEETGLPGQARPAERDRFDRAVTDLTPTGGDGAAQGAGTEKTPSQLFNLAVVLENQGLTDRAMDRYRACLELQPTHDAARFNLARLHFRGGRFDEAVAEYAEALRTAAGGPLHARTLVGLGEALSAAGRPREALERFTRATEIDPRHAPAWSSAGGVLSRSGRHDEAEAAYRRAIDLDPDNVELQSNLGFTLLFLSRTDEAETVFRHAIALDPSHARSRNGLAAVLTEQGSLDEAERMFRENLQLDADDELARGGLSIVEKRRKQRR